MMSTIADALSIERLIPTVLRGDSRRVVLVLAASSFLVVGVQMIYPVVLPDLRAAYGLGLTRAGLLLTVLWLAYAVGQIPGGLLSDRIGAGSTMVGSTLLSGIAILAVVASGADLTLFAATGALGLWIGIYAVSRLTGLAALFPDQVGSATGVTLAAADAGQSLLPPIAGLLTALTVWQFGFAFTVPLFVVVAVALFLEVPGRPGGTTSAGGLTDPKRLRAVLADLRQPVVLVGTAILVLYAATWMAFTGFFPTYLVEEKGLSTTTAGLLLGLFFVLGTVTKPVAGGAYDRVGAPITVAFVGGLPSIALFVLPFVAGLPALLVVTTFVAPLLGSGVVATALILEAISERVRGTAFGLIRAGTFGIAASSPSLFGAAADRGFFDEGFIALAVVSSSMILLAWLLRGR